MLLPLYSIDYRTTRHSAWWRRSPYSYDRVWLRGGGCYIPSLWQVVTPPRNTRTVLKTTTVKILTFCLREKNHYSLLDINPTSWGYAPPPPQQLFTSRSFLYTFFCVEYFTLRCRSTHIFSSIFIYFSIKHRMYAVFHKFVKVYLCVPPKNTKLDQIIFCTYFNESKEIFSTFPQRVALLFRMTPRL